MAASLPLAASPELRQVDPGRCEPAALVQTERAGVAGQRPDDHVVDAQLRELLVDEVEQRRADAFAAMIGEDRQRLELADPIADAPRVRRPSLRRRRDAPERVADEL